VTLGRAYAHTLEDDHLLGAWRYLARRADAAERTAATMF